MATTTDSLTAARAAALFVSDLSVTANTSNAEVIAAIRRSLRTHGGSRPCAAEVAAAYGDYPELAAARMRWALTLARKLCRVPVSASQRSGTVCRTTATRRPVFTAA